MVAVVQLFLAAFLPLLVGLVSNMNTSAKRKTLLLAILTLINTMGGEAVQAWTAGEVYDIQAALTMYVPLLVSSIAIHYGVWKPIGTTELVLQAGVKNEV